MVFMLNFTMLCARVSMIAISHQDGRACIFKEDKKTAMAEISQWVRILLAQTRKLVTDEHAKKRCFSTADLQLASMHLFFPVFCDHSLI